MFDLDAFDAHEDVLFVARPEVGLRAIIAIHDTTLGPAMGGIRMWRYPNAEAAATDALRLSRTMTMKNALAGLAFGGGKSVIMGDARADKSPALLDAFADAIERLGGRYVGAEDVGIGLEDVRRLRQRTAHVSGVGADGQGGDPSPWTARGVFAGLKAAVRAAFGRDDLAGLVVGVQGLGAVGFKLCAHLHRAGCRLVVADLDPERSDAAHAAFGATVSGTDAILVEPVDVLAPCALGGVLDAATIAAMQAKVVAGAANNPLAREADAEALAARGVLYVPDYVLNAGGVIAAAMEHAGTMDELALRRRVDGIEGTVADILARAEREDITPLAAADRQALAMLARGQPRRHAA